MTAAQQRLGIIILPLVLIVHAFPAEEEVQPSNADVIQLKVC